MPTTTTATTTATATTATTAATTTTTTTRLPTTLDAAKLKNINLFQVFVGQINKLHKLVGELFLSCLTLRIVRLHESFPFLCKTCMSLLVRSKVLCFIFRN
jgi:hypothetical protein